MKLLQLKCNKDLNLIAPLVTVILSNSKLTIPNSFRIVCFNQFYKQRIDRQRSPEA